MSDDRPFCVTLVDFAPTQTRDFEGALCQVADSLRIAVRSERSVLDASYPVAVIHAIVLTPRAIARVSEKDVATIRSAMNHGTCRLYLSDAPGAPASPAGSRLDDLIQRTPAYGYRELANEIISFFREADNLNRRSTPLAIRDMICLVAYRILKYLWPVSYVFAAAHILNATTAIAGREVWLGQFVGDYLVPVMTFFGAFFIAHCIIVVVRNWLFAVRIAKGSFSAFAWGATGLGMAAVATAYSVAVIDISISRIFVSVGIAVAVYALYMYIRRIRAECTSLSQLQAAMADPQRREGVLKSIGAQRFGHSAFPLFPFRSRALFISYMRDSQWSSATAALFQQWASKNGFDVFLDLSSIPSGSLWRQYLLRGVSECGFFVAVIDGITPITEWVLAESAYAALLRKSIGKPRILLVIQNARRIIDDKQNPVQLIYLDLFQLPSARCLGATILPVDAEHRLTEQSFLQALEEVQPMCLLPWNYRKSKSGTQVETQLSRETAQSSSDDFQVADRSWRTSTLLVMLLEAEGRSAYGVKLLLNKGFEWMRSNSQEKITVGLNTLRFLFKGSHLLYSRDLHTEVLDVFLSDASLAVKLAALDFLGSMGIAPNPLTQVSDYEAERISEFRAELIRLMNASMHAYAEKGVHVDLASESLGKTHKAALRSAISRVDRINYIEA